MDDIEKQKKQKRIRLIIQIIIIVFLLASAVGFTIYLLPIFAKIQKDEAFRNTVASHISRLGSWSWIALIFIQIVQAILCVIPAGPVVILTGMLYNSFVAVIITIVGQTLGALAIICLVKIFGKSFIGYFIDPESTKKFTILRDRKRCCVLMFSYLLIPVLPKDPIAFIVPFTEVKIRDFIWINVVARLPMTFVSVYFGYSIIDGDISTGFIIGCIVAAISIICFIFNKQITNLLDKLIPNKKESTLEGEKKE